MRLTLPPTVVLKPGQHFVICMRCNSQFVLWRNQHQAWLRHLYRQCEPKAKGD